MYDAACNEESHLLTKKSDITDISISYFAVNNDMVMYHSHRMQ